MAGGVRGGKALKAILLGGAAGSFVTPDDLDLRLTFEDSKAAGVTLGSGVVMVFDEDVDLADIVLRIASFFRDESRGQRRPVPGRDRPAGGGAGARDRGSRERFAHRRAWR